MTMNASLPRNDTLILDPLDPNQEDYFVDREFVDFAYRLNDRWANGVDEGDLPSMEQLRYRFYMQHDVWQEVVTPTPSELMQGDPAVLEAGRLLTPSELTPASREMIVANSFIGMMRREAASRENNEGIGLLANDDWHQIYIECTPARIEDGRRVIEAVAQLTNRASLLVSGNRVIDQIVVDAQVINGAARRLRVELPEIGSLGFNFSRAEGHNTHWRNQDGVYVGEEEASIATRAVAQSAYWAQELQD